MPIRVRHIADEDRTAFKHRILGHLCCMELKDVERLLHQTVVKDIVVCVVLAEFVKTFFECSRIAFKRPLQWT